MEKHYSYNSLSSYIKLFSLLLFLVAAHSVNAQLSGTKNIPGDYATIADAVTALNGVGVGPGGVTFMVAAGHTETLSAIISLTATGTLADQIVFQKNGIGANPLLTAYTGGTAIHTTTAAPHDGLFNLVGADYVTIDGIDLTENIANSGNALMEYGYALLKASPTDGCQNNTIQNCTITLDRTNATTGTTVEADNGATGIWVANTLATGNATVTITTASGSNSDNKFYTNTIQNCNTGIYLRGFADSSPYSLYDQNNDVGGNSSLTGNTIINYGGGGVAVAAHAIRGIYQNGFNFSYNAINSNDGSGVNHTNVLRGIFMSTGTSSSGEISGNTVTIHGGGTTSQITAIENGAGSTANSNTISISNNTVENCTYTTATTGIFEGIVNASTAAIVNFEYNTVYNNSIPGTGSMTLIDGGSPVVVNLFSNTVSNNTKTGASGSMFCIRAGTATVTMDGNSVYDNSFTANSGSSASNLYGLYDLSSPTNETYSNNQVYNLSISGASTSTTSVLYGIYSNTSSSSVKNINGNSVYNLQYNNSSTGKITIIGIFHTLANTANIYNNKIYDLTANNGASSVVYGIQITSGTTHNVYNNLIGNLSSAAANLADAVRGINLLTTTTNANLNISYNTVYINASSSGALFGTTGIFHTTSTTATTGTLVLRNNIIVNTSTANGTGKTAAYRRSSATLTNYGSESNYNLFYAGTPGSSNVIFFDGTNFDENLADYKTRVSPRDASSVSESPNFTSTIGSDPDFLHIDGTIATQIESGAANIAGITDDFDGEIRQGNGGYGGGGTAPDIGADEFEGIPADLNGPAISYSLFGNTSCTLDRDLSATITDASGVNTTAGTKPRMYFKKSTDANTYAGNTSANDGWKWVEASNASSPFDFTTDYSLLQSAIMTGDIIEYFVVAQDMAGTPNVGINSGTFNSTPSSVALIAGNFPIGGTINSYALVAAGLTGTVTIGAAETYPTLTQAGGLFEAINTMGLSGPLTVNIVDASVTETGATALNAINYNGCAAGPYAVTIKPGSGVTSTLTGSTASSSALIKLSGADYVTIDGSNNGTSSRDLTIENTSTSTSTAAIWISSLGTGLGSENNTIKNTIIKAGSNTVSSTFGIYVGGTSISTTGTGNDNDNLAIHNNSISKAYYGIYARAASAGVNNGLNILNNSIGSETAADYIGFRGMQIYQADGAIIEGNTIFNIIGSVTNLRGIELVTGFVNSFVSKNTIYEINYTGTSFSAGKGITISTGSNTSNVTISNNVIYGLKGHGSSTATNNSWGIMFEGGGGYNIYYNSVNLSDDRTSTGSTDEHGAMYVAASVTDIDLRNNVLVSTAAAGNANGKTYALYSLADNTAFLNINYNDYWATGTNRFAGFISATDRTTLADMQAGFGQNVNSLVSDPGFNSNVNLQPQLGSPLINAGTPIAGITTDITGVTRNVSTPTIGAYEQAVDVAPPAITYTALSFTCLTGDRSLNGVLIEDVSGVPTAGALQPRIYYKKDIAGTWFSSQGSLAAGSGTSGTWNFTIIAADMGGIAAGDTVYYYVIAQDIASPLNITSNPSAGLVASDVNTVTTHPTSPNFYYIANTLSGTFMVGTGQTYTTLTAAVNAYNTSCLGGPVVFELVDASYSGNETFPIEINANTYSSVTNTLTIRPAAGTAVNITGSSGGTSTALIRLNGADYVNIDGINSGGASLTIENTSTSAGTGVLWLSSNGTGQGATNNTIENTTFKGGVTTNTSTTVTYGIVIAGSSLATTVASIAAGDDNDNNTFTGNTIIKARYAFISKGGSTTNPNTGTVISANTIGPAAFGDESIGKSGILIREEDGTQITGNEIRFVGGTFATTSGGTDRVGIAFGTDALWTPTSVYVKNAVVKNNLIHDIIDERTFSAVGIAISAADGANATNNVVANNMLYNIKANGTSPDQTIGIGLSAASGDMVVYNTIYLSGDTDPDAGAMTPTVSNFGISISSTSVADPLIKDNIIYMDLSSSSAPALLNACINIPSTYSWGSGLSNYNDFYINPANTQSNTGCVGGNGGVFHLSLANWQAAVSQDANSLDEEPVFTSATDLHLVPASNVALDNFGSPVTGITTDIDGDTRDVTNPDMGADEFTPVAGLDVGIIALETPATAGCFTAAETVTVTLKNFSLSTIDFSVNNVTVTVTATGGYSSDFTLTSGTLLSDATQSVVLPATIDLTANGTYTFNSFSTLAGDITPGNDAMAPVNVLVLTLSGTYPVGVGQSGSGGYETLTAFISDYNTTGCITGNIIAELYDVSYTTPAETFPISVEDNPAAGIYSLTIRPESGVMPTISGSATSIIRVNGADNIIIDGSNNGSSSRDLTISNSSTSTSSAVVWLSTAIADGATNNTIKNCVISGNSSTSTLAGIGFGGSTISVSSLGTDNNNNTVQNNDIKAVQYGIYSQGASSGAKNTGNTITGNLINTPTPGNVGRAGILVGFEDGITITMNTISGMSSSSDVAGIALGTLTLTTSSPAGNEVTNATISKNIIGNVTCTSFNSAAGIYVAPATSGITLIDNNVLSGVTAGATSPDVAVGIYITGGTGSTTNVYFNSVSMTGVRPGSPSFPSFAFAVAGSDPVINIRDNVFYNTQTTTSAGKSYAYGTASTTFANMVSSYNDLFVSGTNGVLAKSGALTNTGGTDYTTLAAWNTATGQDLPGVSLNIEPIFNSVTNLTPLPGSPLVSAGTPIGGITTDVLGVTRNVTNPSMGAYEQAADVTGPIISYNTFPTNLCTSGQTLVATITDISGVNTSSGTKPRVYYKKTTDANTYAGNTSGDNGWKYVEASNASSPFSFTMDFSLLQAPAAGGDVIQYFVVAQDLVMAPNVGIESGSFQAIPTSVALTAAAFPIGGTINSYAIVGGGLATDVTIGAAGTYTTLTGAGGLFAALNSSGLLANITATILDAAVAETGANSLNEIIYGCGGPYTLTVKPEAGVTTVLSGSVTTPLINLNGADRVKFDGSNNGTNSMNMTIRNTSATSGANTIRFINGSTFDTLENVIIEGAITSTTSGVVLFSTTTGSTGNSNNVIDNCHIRDRSDLAGIPTNALYGSGTGTLPNSNNAIVNSNLFNFSSSGINLSSTGLGNNWQITNCNIYNAQATPSASTQNGILIAGGTGHTISENAVGGSGVGATGTWTNTGNVILTGISLTGGVANISNNTVANITAASTLATARIRGIANTSGGLDGVVIDSNHVFNLFSSGSISSYTGGSQPVIGIYVFPGTTWYVSTISNNEIHDLSAENTFANTSSNMAVGILLTNWRGQCFNNKIYDIRNKATGASVPPIVSGIYARFFSQGAVYNNMISIGHGETNNVQYNGIQIVGSGESGNQQYYYHNSIHVGGTGTGTFGSHAFLRGDNSTTSPSHPVDLKNNIFSMVRSGGGAVNYAIASQGTNADTLWVSDYNDLYNSVAANIGYWFATGYDFANWQANTGQDANSISVAPMFVSDTDLHLTLANTGIDNEGTPVLGVTTDFDGTVRNILTPDIGAHEIITSGCPKFITSGADSGAGTLRDAVACAQSGEQLVVDPSVALITLTSGEIDLNKTLIITGHGIDDLSLSGNAFSRIFRLQTGNFLQLEDMTLTNATSAMNGGAIWAQDDMTLKNIRIQNSTENGTPKGYTADPGTLIEFIGDSFINN